MDNPDNEQTAPRPVVKLKISKLVGVQVQLDVCFDPNNVIAVLQRIQQGQNPVAVFAEFIAHLSVRGLQFNADAPLASMAPPSPIALPNGAVDPRGLRVGG